MEHAEWGMEHVGHQGVIANAMIPNGFLAIEKSLPM